MWDIGLFKSQMKMLRGWSDDDSLEQWNALRNDPLVETDLLGPALAPLCLRIPAYLVGKRSTKSEIANFEGVHF